MAKSKVKKKTRNDKVVAVLSYLLVGIVWYFIDEEVKKSSLAKYHVKQAINFIVVAIIVSFVLSILSMIFGMIGVIPVIGWIILGLYVIFSTLVGLALLVLWIIGIINAINEEHKEVPIIGKYAERYLTF